MTDPQPYDALAGLFRYPRLGFPEEVARTQALLDDACPEAAARLRPFTEAVGRLQAHALEELFTRSFEVQALTTLDLSYVLFGDDYKRGQMLVNLNREHQQAGVDCEGELADHLPNVLRLLPRMQDHEVRQELVELIVLPALAKVIEEFEPDVIERKGRIYEKHHRTSIERSEEYGTLYRHPLAAAFLMLAGDFDASLEALPEASRGFLKNLDTEMELL